MNILNRRSLKIGRKANVLQIVLPVLIFFAVQIGAKAQNLANYKNNPTKLKQICDTAKNEKLKAEALQLLASFYREKGDVNSTVTYSLQAISLQKKIYNNGDTAYAKKAASGLTELSYMYLNMGLPEQAKQYTEESRPYIINNKELLSTYYKNMGDALRMYAQAGAKDIAEAKVYYDSLTRYCENSYPKSWHKRIALDLAFADYYSSKKAYSTALEYILKAKSLAPKWADTTLNSQIIYMAGSVYAVNNEHAKALPYLKEAEKYAKEWDPSLYVNLLNSIAGAYGELGQYENAYKYYKRYVPLRDSIYEKTTEKSFMEAEAKFQNVEKSQQIKVKNIEIKNAKTQKLWLILGIGLSLLAVILLFVIYRNKKKVASILDRKNKELDSLNEQLTGANQTKAKLFSIISHDLRSPVSQLFTFLKLQQANPAYISEEEKAQHQQKLMSASTNLLATMEDLLLWSKSQMEQFELTIEEVDLTQLFADATQLMQGQADAKKLELKTELSAVKSIQSDANLLTIVLRNLLQNAINHAFSASVVYLRAGLNSDQQTYIAINNQGEVIPANQIEALLDNSQVKSKSSGYGLLIVKELAQKIGAELKMSSNAENGTEISLIFKNS